MTGTDYERVRQAIENAAFGGRVRLTANSLRVRVGIFTKGKFRNFLAGLRAGGARIEWQEPVGFLNCDWVISGDERAIEAIRQYCAQS